MALGDCFGDDCITRDLTSKWIGLLMDSEGDAITESLVKIGDGDHVRKLIIGACPWGSIMLLHVTLYSSCLLLSNDAPP